MKHAYIDREQKVKDEAKAYLAARANATLGKPIPKPQLVTEEEPDIPADIRAWEEACDQVRRAKELLDLPAEAYLKYPFENFGTMVGGVRPGRVHYYVCASNNGKTTFVRSFIETAIANGQACAVMTSETTPEDFRLSIAAATIGLHPGDVATGEYLKRPDAERVRRDLEAEMDRWTDYENGTHAMLRISEETGYLTPEKIRFAARDAADLGAAWFLIDHVDHIEAGQGTSEYQMSNAVNVAAWRAALDLDLRVICTSQLNQDVFRQNPLGMCMTPQESWVKFGGKKKELGWVMTGGSRPLKAFVSEDDRKDELAAYKKGDRKIGDITLPCAHLRVMKHRDYGDRVGASCLLEVERGRFREPSKEIEADLHGISTQKRSLFE